ncbi:hypothetical protein [Flavobacterium sp. NRK1]|uniref:hypothetical protein n=1 Tax=Flavobacterium sp. NRK1 TaxID=2954929 RepID=UPI002093D809|nr:hypothetical protein [Flavobacterium sp. NRK1]MCO6148000.1 hypothetical protein [Flavobacterium sp. NRK1]
MYRISTIILLIVFISCKEGEKSNDVETSKDKILEYKDQDKDVQELIDLIRWFRDNNYKDYVQEDGVSRYVTYDEEITSSNLYYKSKPYKISKADNYTCVFFAYLINFNFKGKMDKEQIINVPLAKHKYVMMYFRKEYQDGDENVNERILHGSASPDYYEYYPIIYDNKKEFITTVTSYNSYWGNEVDLNLKSDILKALKAGKLLE